MQRSNIAAYRVSPFLLMHIRHKFMSYNPFPKLAEPSQEIRFHSSDSGFFTEFHFPER